MLIIITWEIVNEPIQMERQMERSNLIHSNITLFFHFLIGLSKTYFWPGWQVIQHDGFIET